jgi:hypothetical protein
MADFRAFSAELTVTQGAVHFNDQDRAFFTEEVPCSSEDVGSGAFDIAFGTVV